MRHRGLRPDNVSNSETIVAGERAPSGFLSAAPHARYVSPGVVRGPSRVNQLAKINQTWLGHDHLICSRSSALLATTPCPPRHGRTILQNRMSLNIPIAPRALASCQLSLPTSRGAFPCTVAQGSGAVNRSRDVPSGAAQPTPQVNPAARDLEAAEPVSG